MNRIYTVTQCQSFKRVVRWPDARMAAEYASSDRMTTQADDKHPTVIAALAEPHMQAQAELAQAECNVR